MRGVDMNKSVVKNSESTPFAATWVGLEVIILNEVSQRNAIS